MKPDKAVSLIEKNATAVQGNVSKLDDPDHLYEMVRKVKWTFPGVLMTGA